MPMTLNDNGYAVSLNIDPTTVMVTGSSVTATKTNSGTGNANLAISGSGASPVVNFDLPAMPLLVDPRNGANLGFILGDVCLGYTVGTADATSMTFAAYTYMITDGSAPATNGTAFGGTFTFNEGTSTAISIPVTHSANAYLVQCVPATTANCHFPINDGTIKPNNTRLNFQWGWTNGTSGTLSIYSIVVHGTFILGG